MSSLSSGLIPIGGSGGGSSRSGGMSTLGPLEDLSAGKGGARGGSGAAATLKKAASQSWDEDLDDLLNSLDSSPSPRKAGAGKDSKGRAAAAGSAKKTSKAKSPPTRKNDYYGGGDDFLDSSESFSAPSPVAARQAQGSKAGKNTAIDEFDLSMVSDTALPAATGAKASLIDDMVTSQDLDDSILGGLVGASSKTANSARKTGKDSSLPPKHPSSSTSALGSPPATSSFGKRPVAVAKANDSELAESNSFDTDDDFALPIFGSNEGRGRAAEKPRPHTSSGIPSRSRSRSRSPNLSGSESSPLPSPAKGGASGAASRAEDTRPYSAPVPSSPDAKSFSNPKAKGWDDDSSKPTQAEDSSMPFIPSFYDPSRRTRRNIGGDSSRRPGLFASKDNDNIEELDKLLGTGSAAPANKGPVLPPSINSPKMKSMSVSDSDEEDSKRKRPDTAARERDIPSDTKLSDDSRPSTSDRPLTGELVAKSSNDADAIKESERSSDASKNAPVISTTEPVKSEAAPGANKPSATLRVDVSPEPKGILKLSRPKSPGSGLASRSTFDYPSAVDEEGARVPAWLGGGSVGAVSSPQSVNRHGSPAEKADGNLYRSMKQRMEEMQLEKEAVERHLRLEIEGLKNVVSLRQAAGYLGGNGGSSESIEAQLQITALNNEISRLKDELLLQSAKHEEEIRLLKDRAADDLRSAEARRKDDIRVVELRHEEVIAGLKRLHAEEISSIKQRAKDGMALEELTSQIRNTTGSLRLIEEQMTSQYRGLDIVKEGQFDARERVLKAAEEKARERAEMAEAEGYRLKGVLAQMEQMITSLRSQGMEERERLKYEHRRLEAAQLAMDAERKSFQSQYIEESEQLKAKQKSFDASCRAKEYELEQKRKEFELSAEKFESDKEAFKLHIQSSVKSTNDAMRRMQEEENKLVRLREEMRRESQKLKEQRNSAMNDLLRADEFRAAIEEEKRKIAFDRTELERVAQHVQKTSEELERMNNQLDERANSLMEREGAVEQGFAELQAVGMQLSLKEQNVMTGKKWVEEHQLAMREAEDELLNKKIAMATMQRKTYVPPQLLTDSSYENRGSSRAVAVPSQYVTGLSSNVVYPESVSRPARSYSDADRTINNSMKSINNTLRSSRNEMNKLNLDRVNTFNFIAQESRFVNKSLR